VKTTQMVLISGLFMGFSVISLIEIIYFLSLRPYCALRRAEMQESIYQKKSYNQPHHGVRKTTLGGNPHLNEFYVQSEAFQHKLTICEELRSKLISCAVSVRDRISNAWMTFVEVYKDDGQAPYPYFN
jgi:hypothetical protein